MESSHQRVNKVDVIIVGAGLSGLTAATRILEREPTLSVKIIECSGLVGGQIGAVAPLGEIGGKWITEDQYHIINLWHHLKLPPLQKRIVWGASPHLKRCWDLDQGFLAPLARFELQRYVRELDLKAPLYRPGLYNVRQRGCPMSYHIRHRLFFEESCSFMLAVVLLCTGVEAQFISYEQFMCVACSYGGVSRLLDLYIYCPSNLLEVRSEPLLHALLERCQQAEILLWRRIDAVRQYCDHVEVLDSAKQVHTADVVVLAVPWNSIEEMQFSPAMPKEMREPPLPIDHCRMQITSFLAQYHEPHWRQAGYSGQFMSTKPPHLLLGHEYRPCTYAGLVVHEEGLDPLVRSVALQRLAESFGAGMLLPAAYSQRTFTASTLLNVPFTSTWQRVVWASSAAAATSYRGCLGGAVQSGWRAAIHALLIVRPQQVTWQDIAEIHAGAGKSVLVQRQQANALTRWLSSCNVYDVMLCGVLGLTGVLVMMRKMRRGSV